MGLLTTTQAMVVPVQAVVTVNGWNHFLGVMGKEPCLSNKSAPQIGYLWAWPPCIFSPILFQAACPPSFQLPYVASSTPLLLLDTPTTASPAHGTLVASALMPVYTEQCESPLILT